MGVGDPVKANAAQPISDPKPEDCMNDMTGIPSQVHSQAARGAASPRRYVGRAAGGGGLDLPAAQSGAAQPTALPSGPAAAAVRLTWSFRLVAAIVLVSALGVGVRATGLLSSPVDPPAGVESTH